MRVNLRIVASREGSRLRDPSRSRNLFGARAILAHPKDVPRAIRIFGRFECSARAAPTDREDAIPPGTPEHKVPPRAEVTW
jgi:hypothetical protein